MRPPFTGTFIWVEPSSSSYLGLLVHNDLRRLSPPDAKGEVTVNVLHIGGWPVHLISIHGATKTAVSHVQDMYIYSQTPLYVLSAIRIFDLRTIFFKRIIHNTYQNFDIRTSPNIFYISFRVHCSTYILHLTYSFILRTLLNVHTSLNILYII
jgi:hypothetical protein